MRRRHYKSVLLVLGCLFLGVAALLAYIARKYAVPLSILMLCGLLAAIAVLAPGLWSWGQRARLDRALRVLIGAAQRISRGEYRQALVSTPSAKVDKLGELENAFETMRLALRNTTYSRNYLYSVLNSMTDAVFVTTPGGEVRVANEAALRLSGLSEHELVGMPLVNLIDNAETLGEEPLRLACEAGEAVLRTGSGQTIPVSFVGSKIATDDPEFEGDIYVARDITERKRAERRIRYLARYDALTKIPNRMQFQHLLQQSIARSLRSGQSVAMLYIDMDRFKEVNDTFGHASGDRVLEVLTERLVRVVNSEAVLGRLAGDEFALFVDGLSADREEAKGQVVQLANTVLHVAGESFHINQQEVFLTVSIGVGLCPHDAENVIDLIRNADAAMYYSKQNGGNTYAFYTPEMNAAAVERLMLKSKLRRAIERDEFVVLYQPKVDLRTGGVVGAEALLRWRVPGHGDIPPSQFIPIAEENGLIGAIGEWVLERVCKDFRTLRLHVEDPGRISLNLSLKQLKQASFILNCRSIFERYAVPTRSFELEITETTLMADPRRTVQMLRQLSDMGLHLSIDDFGTGYSSLSALQQFPIGTLKVDQSFVRDAADDPADAVLVKTIIDMGHSLSMAVVAEGVESVRQLEFLREHGCNQAQGQLFGPALTIDELKQLLMTQQAGSPAFAKLLPVQAARQPRLA